MQAYHDYAESSWASDEAISGRKRALQSKILPTDHFFYRKVTIERPQRMRFDLNTETLQSFILDPACEKLNDGGRLLAAVNRIIEKSASQAYVNAEAFREAIQEADDANGVDAGQKISKLKAKQLEVARKFFGIRDKKAEITTNEKGEVVPDADLREAEYISFKVVGNDVAAGIQAYFDAEVKPHWPDAWINTGAKDARDEQIGLVGAEINFNREFYVYQAPRTRDAIKHDIEAMEQRFMEMLKGVAA